jgi:hypothetical protein
MWTRQNQKGHTYILPFLSPLKEDIKKFSNLPLNYLMTSSFCVKGGKESPYP